MPRSTAPMSENNTVNWQMVIEGVFRDGFEAGP